MSIICFAAVAAQGLCWGDRQVADMLGKNSKAYISFGGLLMSLEGPYKKLTPLRVDYVYLLVRKR